MRKSSLIAESFDKPYLTVWDAAIFLTGIIILYFFVNIVTGSLFYFYKSFTHHISIEEFRTFYKSTFRNGYLVVLLYIFLYSLISLLMAALLLLKKQNIMEALAIKPLSEYHFRFLFFLTFLLLCLSIALSIVFHIRSEDSYIKEIFATGKGLIVFCLFGAFIAPVFEEIVFRGFLFNPLERKWGKQIAAIIVTVIFVIGHTPSYWKSISSLILIVPVSMSLAWLRALRGSIIPGIIIHITYNSVSVSLLYLNYYLLQHQQ